MSIFTSTHKASAKVADGRLVLSLPDAETPVLWVMDLDDAATSVIRLETDKQGNHVLKKYGAKGAAETIAVYRNHKNATTALVKAASALENARDSRLKIGSNAQPVIIRPQSLVMRIFTAFALFWVTAYLALSLYGYAMAYRAASQAQTTPAQQAAPAQPSTPQNGVPMSADDFLKNNANK